MPGSTRPRALDALCATAFLAALAAPAADRIARPDAARDTRHENRAPAPAPAAPRDVAQVLAWPAAFEAWFRDTSGLRDVLLRARNGAALALGLAPTRDLVPGPRAWISYGGEGVLAAQRGTERAARAQAAAWSLALAEHAALCARHGARLVAAFVPNKESIYPEMLPAAWAPVGPSPQDLLLAELARGGAVAAVDLRPALRAAKALDRPAVEDYVYYPRGTHWTARGACAASALLVAALGAAASDAAASDSAPAVPKGGFAAGAPAVHDGCADWERVPLPADAEDSWLRNLYLRAHLMPAWSLAPPDPARVTGGPPVHDGGTTIALSRAADRPSVLFVHDSQGPFVHPFLAGAVRRLRSGWGTGLDPRVVEHERPDVVLVLLTERAIARQPAEILGPAAPATARADETPAWSIENAAEGAEVLGGGRFERDGRAVAWIAPGPLARFVIDLRGRSTGGRALLVEIEVETPAAGRIDFVRGQSAGEEFARRWNTPLALPAGRSTERFVIASPPSGRILVTCSAAGRFAFQRLALRALEH